MNKKLLAVAGLGTGAILTGAGLVVRHISKKAKQKEMTMEMLAEMVIAFMNENKTGIYDLKTIKFIKKLRINNEELSEEQIKELLELVTSKRETKEEIKEEQ